MAMQRNEMTCTCDVEVHEIDVVGVTPLEVVEARVASRDDNSNRLLSCISAEERESSSMIVDDEPLVLAKERKPRIIIMEEESKASWSCYVKTLYISHSGSQGHYSKRN